jgi:hypothetical protein
MKKLIILLSLILTTVLVSCQQKTSAPTADKKLQKQTERTMSEANRQVGFPSITRFQEKKNMKMIYELRDQENLICYAYLVNEVNGKVGQFLGKTIGYGLPYSTQFSNPQKITDPEVVMGYRKHQGEGAFLTIEQPEPNGLFMPEGLSATWLLLIDPKTKKPRPVYVEPSIIVSPFPLH